MFNFVDISGEKWWVQIGVVVVSCVGALAGCAVAGTVMYFTIPPIFALFGIY